jgi:hypothetical protein
MSSRILACASSLVGLLVAGCTSNPGTGATVTYPRADSNAAAVNAGTMTPVPPETPMPGITPDPRDNTWTCVRVGGDRDIRTTRSGDNYAAGTARINTPLPVGYPEPTPPGAIDIKRYPSVRRAQIGTTTVASDLGMNFGFFPLFNHIKRRNIEMTSPVEMDYTGYLARKKASDNERWPERKNTMSFLYRTPELGEKGTDERDARVEIIDTEPLTVVSIGLQGDYGLSALDKGLEQLERWLAASEHWELAGEARALYYNGPDVRARDRWAEIQLPIRPRTLSK